MLCIPSYFHLCEILNVELFKLLKVSMAIVLQFVDTTEETELRGLGNYKKTNLFSATFFSLPSVTLEIFG